MKTGTARLRVIRILQHIFAALLAFIIAYSIAGTSIMIQGLNGYYSYNLYESDRTRSYEESYLFNNILGNSISDILRHVAVRTQLETDGQYDDRKQIDVTAYVNRGATLSGDYVTAVYNLSDLLKWAQSGFKYETKKFTEAESADFLNSSTTYTHLKNNNFSGGMNSYLNSQIEGNSLTFAISGNSVPSGGEHTYLLSRYQTVDGKNIEDIVSNWEEYGVLCSYVEEAAKDLLANYEEYSNAVSYYDYLNTNLRYYISRTIDGKASVYTNVPELSWETTGKNIRAIFESYGKYIYYCPYEIKYETNTLIKENVVRGILKNYSYAYPDQIKLYIAVDTNNYPAVDAFTDGRDSFARYMPYKSQLLFLGAIAALLYIVLTIMYLMLQKKFVLAERDMLAEAGEPIQARKKGMYTELIVLIGLAIMAFPVLAISSLRFVVSTKDLIGAVYFPYLCAAGAFVMSIGLLLMIYSLARKALDRTLWSESALKALIELVKKAIVNTTDNGNVIIRSWVPFVFFVALNLVLFKLGIAGIFVAVCFDILVGIYRYRQNLDRDKIINVIENIENGDVKAKVDVNSLHSDNIKLAEAVNSIGEGIDKAVNTSMKDEKLKADLITNVSHDIKTPLTSIINYVDLLKREEIDNDKARGYIAILDEKSQKLKQLTEDLVEASKISSGNISIQLSRINFVELVNQTMGEFYEKFESHSLQPIFKSQMPDMMIQADARHLWRVLENLMNNVCKYALEGTRVYMDMRMEEQESGNKVVFSIKNISASELNIDATELTERFIRGDVSRTTEGSGLGLSIAKNLTTAMGGTFDIRLDGDLFKVIIKFNSAE